MSRSQAAPATPTANEIGCAIQDLLRRSPGPLSIEAIESRAQWSPHMDLSGYPEGSGSVAPSRLQIGLVLRRCGSFKSHWDEYVGTLWELDYMG